METNVRFKKLLSDFQESALVYIYISEPMKAKIGENWKDSFSGGCLTPVAGLIFEAKIERYFLESFFLERNFCPEQLSRAKNVARFN
jgi:hypothetical protein